MSVMEAPLLEVGGVENAHRAGRWRAQHVFWLESLVEMGPDVDEVCAQQEGFPKVKT
jgi:hypothetical protein